MILFCRTEALPRERTRVYRSGLDHALTVLGLVHWQNKRGNVTLIVVHHHLLSPVFDCWIKISPAAWASWRPTCCWWASRLAFAFYIHTQSKWSIIYQVANLCSEMQRNSTCLYNVHCQKLAQLAWKIAQMCLRRLRVFPTMSPLQF